MKSVEIKKIFYFVILILFLVTSFFTIKYLFFNKKSSNSSSGFNITNQHLYSRSFLYLYPKKETKVTVSFDDFKKVNRTYPLYKDKWIVTAKSNGDLEDKNRNIYFALYWEESNVKKVDFKNGYYVTKDESKAFLEDKLKYIGLNDKERNEFIIYWLPVLESNNKSVVYFELTEERNKLNKINISPKPDSVLRVKMHIKKVDKKPSNLEKQKLSYFYRKGFSVVEAGGVMHR